MLFGFRVLGFGFRVYRVDRAYRVYRVCRFYKVYRALGFRV